MKFKRKSTSKRIRKLILERDNYTCQICGSHPAFESQLVIDHKIPVSKGGSNKKSNLWALCRWCDKQKKDSIIDEVIIDYLRIRISALKRKFKRE
jgi:5-methylcytosine-specific restriction endonuclease McrA